MGISIRTAIASGIGIGISIATGIGKTQDVHGVRAWKCLHLASTPNTHASHQSWICSLGYHTKKRISACSVTAHRFTFFGHPTWSGSSPVQGLLVLQDSKGVLKHQQTLERRRTYFCPYQENAPNLSYATSGEATLLIQKFAW